MIEVIYGNNRKKMAMVMCEVTYDNDRYVVYCIDRGKMEVNIFVSKLVISSDGYTFNNRFKNGEKEVIDNVIKRIINKEDISKDGFSISNNVNLSDINRFDLEECYVATINKRVIKEVMIHYNLVNDKVFEKPVVDVVDDKKVFNEGFVGNIFLIVFGIVVIMFCIVVVSGVFR